MRICYVHSMSAAPAQRGGPGVHIESSVAALRGLGHVVEVLGPRIDVRSAPQVPSADGRSALRRWAARYGYEPRALVRGVWRACSAAPAAHARTPDVVVARYEAFDLSALVLARWLGVPLVWEVNGTSREITAWGTHLCVYPGTRVLERAVLNAGTALFAVSEELRQELRELGVDVHRVAVIPNGADPELFQPGRRDSALSIEPEEVVVGFLGSFSRWHDSRTLLATVSRVLAADRRVRVVLAGPIRENLPPAEQEALAALGDRVVLPGVVPIADVPRWMERFDVALSLYGRLAPFHFSPVKLFEYMAAGCAVVATAIGQQARVIRDGVNGRLVPPTDVGAVTDAVLELVRTPALRRRLGDAARDTIVRRYTWRHNAARIAALCKEALAASQRGERVVLQAAAAAEPAA